MNALRISKGKDIKLCVDDEQLCFVTDFSAKEISDSYPVSEILSDIYVAQLPLKKHYVICITALSHLDEKVFDKADFVLSVEIENTKYVYKNCVLKEKQKDVNGAKPIVTKYTLAASELETLEVVYE